MNGHRIQIIETLIVLALYVIIYLINKRVINNALKNTHLQRGRRKIIIKALQLFTSIAAIVIIAAIWGLKQSEIAVFATSILTALGIAFFAQWSLLSNVTSSIILFFNHPLKLGDNIKILDKDYPVEGEVKELTYFFIHLKTKNGETITIPNSMALQKSISVVEQKVSKDKNGN
jgi:small-conductance mechanosensitive channel